MQEIEQRQREKNVAQIQADTQVARAQEEAQVILFEANAKATQIKLGASAQVEAVRARFAAEREVCVCPDTHNTCTCAHIPTTLTRRLGLPPTPTAQSYVVLAKEIGLTPSELLSYIWLDAVQEGLVRTAAGGECDACLCADAHTVLVALIPSYPPQTNSIIKLPLPALVGTFGN